MLKLSVGSPKERQFMKRVKLVTALLVGLLVISSNYAFAGKTGSKSESASAAWLVEGINSSCNNGTSPSNLTDNYVDNDNAFVWIKSSASVDSEYINWTSTDKGRYVNSGDLDYTGVSCGQFLLMAFDVGSNDDLYYDGYYYSNSVDGYGSITFKFDYNGKSFTSDTAQLY